MTGIFKTPVDGIVRLKGFNIEGDTQADLSVHGGYAKSVYAYPHEHYAYWQSVLPDYAFTMGNFGENLTTQGLLESDVHIGDQFRIGNAIIMAIQPRVPCYKLGIRFNNPHMVKMFLQSQRLGIYFAIVKEGEFQNGAEIEPYKSVDNSLTISDISRIFVQDRQDLSTLQRAMKLELLPKFWKEEFSKQIKSIQQVQHEQ